MGWDISVDVPCVHTLLLRHWLGFGWGWVITFMWLAHTRDATLLLRHWLGFGWGCFYPFWNMRINMYYIYIWFYFLCHMRLQPLDVNITCVRFTIRWDVHCFCTPVASTVCGNCPMVQCQPLGAHVKMVLWTLSCFKELGFGNGDGTMEIAQTFSVSPATLWANHWRSKTPKEQGNSDHPASSTKPCKYHDIPSKSSNFPRENLR